MHYKTVFINHKEDGIIHSQEVLINSTIKLDSPFIDMAYYLNEGKWGGVNAISTPSRNYLTKFN